MSKTSNPTFRDELTREELATAKELAEQFPRLPRQFWIGLSKVFTRLDCLRFSAPALIVRDPDEPPAFLLPGREADVLCVDGSVRRMRVLTPREVAHCLLLDPDSLYALLREVRAPLPVYLARIGRNGAYVQVYAYEEAALLAAYYREARRRSGGRIASHSAARFAPFRRSWLAWREAHGGAILDTGRAVEQKLPEDFDLWFGSLLDQEDESDDDGA